MKTVIVGDLHGQHEIAEEILQWEHNVVFIGDYLDSFTTTKDEQIHTLDLVLNAATREPERVTALKGNHEMSYLESGMRCSGYSPITQHHVDDRDLSILKPYTWVDGYLVSHAGISANILRWLEIDYETYLREGNFNQIGFARGGTVPCGGLFWCDWNFEFEPLEIPQVVGHTRGKSIRQNQNSYCIDNLEDIGANQVLVIEDGEARIEVL